MASNNNNIEYIDDVDEVIRLTKTKVQRSLIQARLNEGYVFPLWTLDPKRNTEKVPFLVKGTNGVKVRLAYFLNGIGDVGYLQTDDIRSSGSFISPHYFVRFGSYEIGFWKYSMVYSVKSAGAIHYLDETVRAELKKIGYQGTLVEFYEKVYSSGLTVDENLVLTNIITKIEDLNDSTSDVFEKMERIKLFVEIYWARLCDGTIRKNSIACNTYLDIFDKEKGRKKLEDLLRGLLPWVTAYKGDTEPLCSSSTIFEFVDEYEIALKSDEDVHGYLVNYFHSNWEKLDGLMCLIEKNITHYWDDGVFKLLV